MVVALGLDGTSFDDDIAVVMFGISANGCAAGGMGVYPARAGSLAVNRQRTALGNIQSLHVQRFAVAQDQVDIAGDGYNAAVFCDIAVQVIPAGGNNGVVRERLPLAIISSSRFRYDLLSVPAALHIRGNGTALNQHGLALFIQRDSVVIIIASEIRKIAPSIQTGGEFAGRLHVYAVTVIRVQLGINDYFGMIRQIDCTGDGTAVQIKIVGIKIYIVTIAV